MPATADPIAAKSAFLCTYMQGHPGTLVAFVKHFGRLDAKVSRADMTAVDSQGMTLAYELASGGNGQVHVPFRPPLAGYDEFRPRLLAMKADAQESLGILKPPQLTSFRFPSSALSMVPIALSCAYLTTHPPPGAAVAIPYTTLVLPAGMANVLFAPARAAVGWLGFRPTFRTMMGIVLAFHAVEAVYTWVLCRRYVRGCRVRAAYVVATLACGAPIWMDIHRRVRQKRIENAMKTE